MGSKVKVFVRLRPLLSKETDNEMPDRCAKKISDKQLQLWNYRNPKNEALEYEFDNVFDSDAKQSEIYAHVKSIVPNILNGQNATIFGYGPTGAGKTHTIVGTQEQPGLIPRCINYLFKLIKIKSNDRETISIQLSMLEIYQEKVYDLLVPKSKDLPLRQDASGNIFIPELAEVEVNSFNGFMKEYQSASNNRTIGSTNLNAHSSRSHTILLVKVVKTTVDYPNRKFHGKLYLIDLAGSEDNRKTGNTGVRLKESGSINSSLFSLSMVVDALNKNHHRIPYRDSKLTRLLQDSIGGTAHSVMIACIAPEPSFYWDTLNTLKFASKSRQVTNQPFTKVVDEVSRKRHSNSKEDATTSKRRAVGSSITKSDERNKENQDEMVKNLKKLLDPIGRRQKEIEKKFESRLKALENVMNNGKKSEASCLPLANNTKDNIPVGKVKPLMKKSQPAFCQTPSTQPVIALDTPPSNSTTFMKGDPAISLPNFIENGGRTPKYAITLDPKLREEWEVKVLNILNNGTVKEIMTLPTIGKKRAEQLHTYRTQNGEFSSLSDLVRVGFSSAVLKNLKKKYILERLVIS